MYLAEKEGKAKGEKIMYKKHFYTAVILLLLLAVGIQPALATITLSKLGWSDPTVGTWDEDTLTGTLTDDVFEPIQISNTWWDGISEDDLITLNGNGYTVNGSDWDPEVYPNGVDLELTTWFVTIKNLNITTCYNGIVLNTSSRINVINNDVSSCQYGICIGNSGTSIIKDNTISDCTEYGIWLSGAVNNKIYNNNFVNRPNFQAYVTGGSGNVFDWDGIGNYWSDYTGLDEEEPWGIGDTTYYFDGGQDNCPLMPTPQTKIVELIDTVEVMNLHQGIDNSLDAKLDAAANALDDVNQNNDVAAINSLNAFINAVEAQRDNKITNEQADTLIADANYIITLLSG
jgi:parallel beta-helix repeat protein